MREGPMPLTKLAPPKPILEIDSLLFPFFRPRNWTTPLGYGHLGCQYDENRSYSDKSLPLRKLQSLDAIHINLRGSRYLHSLSP